VPTLSVVIPAYDAAGTVAEAARSATTQSDVDLEVIVVDDGSRDRTAEIAAAEPGVTVIRQDNRGPAAARNTGIRAASGDYVGFLDADDRLLPGWASAVIDLLQSGAQIAVTDTAVVDATTGRQISSYAEEVAFPAPPVQRRSILTANFIQSTACLRRSTLDDVGPFDESFRGVEDWDLWIRVLYAGGHALRDERCLSVYRRGHQSLSSNRVAMAQQELRLLEKCRGLPMDAAARLSRENSVRLRQGRLELLLGADEAASGRRSAARRYLTAALRLRQPRLLLRATATAAAPRFAAAHGSLGLPR
jgi:glycosyltransferase involved in cell wall biosynthesis